MRLVHLIAAAAFSLVPAVVLVRGAAAPGRVPSRPSDARSTAGANAADGHAALRILLDAIGSKASLASPTFSGTVAAPSFLGDLSGSRATPTGAPTARMLAEHLANYARPEDNRRMTDPDDTLSLQRAADTGRTVVLQDGKTYVLCRSIAGLRFIGLGTGATIAACPSGFPYGGEPANSFIHNPNWSAPWSATKIDKNAFIENISFDGTNVPKNGMHANTGEFHAVKFRMVDGVRVHDINCINIGDCTAFQGTNDSIVSDSTATGVTNAGFDHWDGVTNATAENNTVSCADSGADAGIMFTGTSTDSQIRTSSRVTSRGNRVLGGKCRIGVWFNTVAQGSKIEQFASEGDYVDAAGGPQHGVVIEGDAKQGRVAYPMFKNGGGGQAIVIKRGDAGSAPPDRIDIVGPRILDWTTSPGNYSPLTLLGTNTVASAIQLTGGTNATSVTTLDGTTSVSGTFQPATSVRVLNCLAAGCVTPGTVVAGTGTAPDAVGVVETWNPAVTCDTGSLGSNSRPVARYTRTGKQITVRITHAIASFGSCATGVSYLLPTPVAASTTGSARDIGSDAPLGARVLAADGAVRIVSATGGTPTTTGGFEVSATYEVP